MNDKDISSSPSSDGEERIRPARAELKDLERRIHELEIGTKPKKDDLWGAWLRRLVLLALAISAGEMIWAVPYTIHKRAELAASRINANIKLAELQAELLKPGYAATEPTVPSSPTSPANESGVSPRARDAFHAAVIESVEQPRPPGAAGHIAATTLSILDQLVKAGTTTKAEAQTLASQLMKAGIDVTKDVATEFGKAGARWLFGDKKDVPGKSSGTPSLGSVFNYFTCSASSETPPQAPQRSPGAPRSPKGPAKPLACPATSERANVPASPDAELINGK